LSYINSNFGESFSNRLRYLDGPYLREVIVDTLERTFNHQSFIDLSKYDQEMKSVVQLNDTFFSARNNYPEYPESAHFLFSNTSKKIHLYGEHPAVDIEFEDYNEKSTFLRYRSVVNKSLQRIMLFYVKANLLRIYDYDGNLLTEKSIEDYKITESYKDQILYFESPFNAGEEVFVLYYNQKFEYVNNNLDDVRPVVHVYNWNGDFLRQYSINYPIFKVTVDSESRTIFGLTLSDENPLVKGVY
jgi:hypothetical protein